MEMIGGGVEGKQEWWNTPVDETSLGDDILAKCVGFQCMPPVVE